MRQLAMYSYLVAGAEKQKDPLILLFEGSFEIANNNEELERLRRGVNR